MQKATGAVLIRKLDKGQTNQRTFVMGARF